MSVVAVEERGGRDSSQRVCRVGTLLQIAQGQRPNPGWPRAQSVSKSISSQIQDDGSDKGAKKLHQDVPHRARPDPQDFLLCETDFGEHRIKIIDSTGRKKSRVAMAHFQWLAALGEQSDSTPEQRKGGRAACWRGKARVGCKGCWFLSEHRGRIRAPLS